MIEKGQRIIVKKSDLDQEQRFPAGERGTILKSTINDNNEICMVILFDNGQYTEIKNTQFRFEVYDK